MEASTARACLRRLSPFVNSVRIDQARSRVTMSRPRGGGCSGSADLLAPPLVDGLLGEDPATVELQARNAPLGSHHLQRRLIHRQVPRGLFETQHVLRGHARSSLSTVLRSVSTSASSVRIRSTSCSSAFVTGSGRSVWLRSTPSTRCPSLYVTRPGTPTTTQLGGTSRTTTEPAPMRLLSPIVKPPMILAPAPTVTLLPSVGCRFSFLKLVPPSVTPCSSVTLSPISAVSPITTPMP